ncbi:HMG-box [Dendrothele bispora CBS 962.96]|uniref:HMG-box n=1 Tax=Dendrothele bispora (strain CBS 962.96) TaxID=1314807 RepID=A0A4S8MET8_DENBC|nr:HMG-box [Dendrothele bispora CBS 962.96]
MKTCAKLAEAYAYAIKKASGSELLLNGVSDDSDVPPNKSKKPKSTVDDEPVESGKRKREKKPKDPNAPKRPASSYILYQNEVRPQLKEKYPDLNIGDLRKLMSEEWAAMSNEDKERYNKLASDAKKNYSEAKRAYDARSPDEVAAANAAAASAAAVSFSHWVSIVSDIIMFPIHLFYID